MGTNGGMQFRADCGRAIWDPLVGPEGAGVLLRPNGGGEDRNTLTWFTQRGKQCSMEVSPNAECAGWIPHTRKSLFMTSLGNESRRFQLIDWDTGRRCWDIPCPGSGELMAMTLTPNLIILSISEPYPALPDWGKELRRTFYAVKVQDGSLVAQWQAQFPHRSFSSDRDRFLQLDDRLFYITKEEVTEINLEDITLKKHGWR